MTLKTSSFKINKTIFTKTVLRFWPIWALYLVILIFTMPVMLYNNVRYVRAVPYDPDMTTSLVITQSDLCTSLLDVLDMNLLPILIAVFAIVSAVAVFSYLYSARSCNMIHAFPVKRTELFVTNYVAGFLFLAVPQVIVALLTMAVCGIFGIAEIQYVALWLVFVLGMDFLFYSMAVFCCMLTGHFFAGFAFFFLFNLFYMVFSLLIITLAEQICYGVNSATADIPGLVLSPLAYLSLDNRVAFDYTYGEQMIAAIDISGGVTIALYCIPAVILIVLALFLYKRRHLECAAEMTAYKFVKPMTRWLVTVVAAMGLSMWFAMVFFGDSTLFIPIMAIMLVVCSWIVFFVLEMAINKKFKIFKKVRFLEWAICLAVLLVTVGLLEGDAFGVEKRVPTVAETKGVIVRAGHEMVVTDAGEVAQIIQAHQEIVDSKAEYEAVDHENDTATEYVNFEYILNNGKSFERSYQIPVSDLYMEDSTRGAALIRSLQEYTNSALKSWLVVNYEELDIIGGTLYKYNEMEVGEQTVLIEKDQMEVLYEAMVKDIQAGNTDHYFGTERSSDYSYLNCHINFSAEMSDVPINLYDLMEQLRDSAEDTNRVFYSETTEIYAYEESYYYATSNTGMHVIDAYFDLTTDCKYTIQALLDLELIEDVTELMDEETQKYYVAE